MMTTQMLTRDEVVEYSSKLPGFPRIIALILDTIDDPDANTRTLTDHIGHDPVIAARVLSLANMAAMQARRQSPVQDIFTATSLVGMNHVRQLAIVCGIAGFVDGIASPDTSSTFWQHSVAVGVCSEELSLHTTVPVSASAALIAGLLHDIGQIWLYHFNAEAFRATWGHALASNIGIEAAERERFGVDHSTIGAWLATHWALPESICAAIRHHHEPDVALAQPLVPIVHIAEVLSNALDLSGRAENRVTSISTGACDALGLTWDGSARSLFGRMEARSRHANAFFNQA
jgi:putative nucleotidyltransferase with HDIG domain